MPPLIRAATHASPRRAEPRGIGSAGARDPLAREIKLVGALLGEIIVEQEGPALFDLVEGLRRAAIRRRSTRETEALEDVERAIAAASVTDQLAVARAFTAYFWLINLAEEKQRLRVLRRRQRASARSALPESVADGIEQLRTGGMTTVELDSLLDRLLLRPVLTAHPTEARRRTVLMAQRRMYRLLDGFDDPRLTPSEDREARRRLREEIGILWQTSQSRRQRPSPLDEVRAAMAFFDETLFNVTPRVYRALDRALVTPADGDEGSGERRPTAPAFLRWGSWVGGDRDGHPGVTAEITRASLRIQADHVLHGYRNVVDRLLQTVAIGDDRAAIPPDFKRWVMDLAREFPEQRANLTRRFAGQPYRQAFGIIGERIERTRIRLTGRRGVRRGGYHHPSELIGDLQRIQASLCAHRAERVAWGEVQDLVWQVETFGFHLAALEVRQHAEIHAAALERLRNGGATDEPLGPTGPTTDEVLATLRTIGEIHHGFGPEALPRYVISFTRRPADVTAVLELAARANPSGIAELDLDVVPLLESRDALSGAGRLLEQLVDDAGYRPHLRRRGMRQEVMLGYSDSCKETGYLAASWSLYRAQEQLVNAARRAGVELTLFHGRGGTIGRGGGPANRAVLAQAPGSVNGRLALTEQGEMIAERYSSPGIAQRHLEQLTSAVVLASRPRPVRETTRSVNHWRPMMDELAALAHDAYRRLVWDDPAFVRFFRSATPIDEIGRMELGSRPPRRSGAIGQPTLEGLRAIPWVFAWTQSRINLPAWFGVGTALAAYLARHPNGRAQLTDAYRNWAFLRSTVDNVELELAIAEPAIAARYASLAGADEPMRHIADAIETERQLTIVQLAAITGNEHLLERSPRLRHSIELRTPYVDVLSLLQIHALHRLRAGSLDALQRRPTEELLHLTVSGVAAGLQHTG